MFSLFILGLWGPAIALIGLSYAPEGNMVYAVVMLTLAVGINAGQYTGYMVRNYNFLNKRKPIILVYQILFFAAVVNIGKFTCIMNQINLKIASTFKSKNEDLLKNIEKAKSNKLIHQKSSLLLNSKVSESKPCRN